MSISELAASYAALILADEDIDITASGPLLRFGTTLTSTKADKLLTLIKTASVDDVEPIWTTLFAKALEGKNVKDMLLNVGSGGGAAAAPSGAASGGGAVTDIPAEEEKKAEKEEEKEESDEDMGFGLFD